MVHCHQPPYASKPELVGYVRPLQAQVALGNGGFHVLIDALRKERSDLELVRGVLECLAIAVQPEERESHRQVCEERLSKLESDINVQPKMRHHLCLQVTEELLQMRLLHHACSHQAAS